MRSADWLAGQFGLEGAARLDGPVDHGFQGEVWRLTSGGSAYAVKETLAPIDAAQVRAAYALQTRAQAFGVRAPRQLLTVTGAPAVQADGETLRLYDWVELAAPDRGLDPTAVGRTLAALHRCSIGEPADLTVADVDPWFLAPVGRDRWVELVAELRCAGASFAADLDALVEQLAATESIMVAPRDVIVCHRDLWADNVRADPAGEPVVIDWDNCGPASAAGELAMVLVEFGTSAERAHALYAAYRGAGGPAALTGPGDFTMPIAVMHHLVELGACQWLTAADDLARERAAGRVREFTDDPFLLPDAERLLAAISSR